MKIIEEIQKLLNNKLLNQQLITMKRSNKIKILIKENQYK